jgi:transposase
MASLASRVEWKDSAKEIWEAYKKSTCAVERRRLQVLALLREGKKKSEVLAVTQYSSPHYSKVLHLYQAGGLRALQDGRRNNPGAPPLLSDEELLLLAQSIRDDYQKGDIWNGARVQQWVKEELGKDIYIARAYEFLHAIQFSQQEVRPQHANVDLAAQETFKKRHSQKESKQLKRVVKMSGYGVKTNIDLD